VPCGALTANPILSLSGHAIPLRFEDLTREDSTLHVVDAQGIVAHFFLCVQGNDIPPLPNPFANSPEHALQQVGLLNA